MGNWFLILWVTTAPAFTVTVQSDSIDNCHLMAKEMTKEFAHAKYLCVPYKENQ